MTGTIRINGRPAEGVRLWFTPGSANLLDVPAGTDGSFDVRLPSPGQYRIMVMGDSIFTQGTSVSFESGAQNWNWDISGGTITVHAIAAGGAGDLSLYLEQADGSNQDRRIPDASVPIARRGVPTGTYQLSLKKSGKPASSVTEVTIENADSAVDVVLRETR